MKQKRSTEKRTAADSMGSDIKQKVKHKKAANNRTVVEHQAQIPPPPPPAPEPKRSRSASSRLPNGVSGWLELSARHRSLGYVGARVFQRRFFEIDWHARCITYYNSSERDGEFYRGVGRKKVIPMSSIIRLDYPSRVHLAGHFPRSRRLAAFDIVSAERIYTAVPLKCTNDFSLALNKKRDHDMASEASAGSSSCFPFSSSGDTANCSPYRCRRPDTERSCVTPAEPTLYADDFQFCIISRDFSPTEASTQLGRLLLSREVTESGLPWEFECPLTLEVMDDPVLAADGYTYERSAIESWFKKQPIVSPLTHKPIPSKLKPNFRLREEIAAYEKARLLMPTNEQD